MQTKRTATTGKLVLTTLVPWHLFESKLVNVVTGRLKKPKSTRDDFAFNIHVSRVIKP